MINLLLPINNSTGYGITSTNIWKEMRQLTDVCVFPIGGIQLEYDVEHPLAQEDINRTLEGNSRDAPCLKIWHMHDLFSRVGNGRYGHGAGRHRARVARYRCARPPGGRSRNSAPEGG